MSSRICGKAHQPFCFDAPEPNFRLHAACDLAAARSAARDIFASMFLVDRLLAVGLESLVGPEPRLKWGRSSSNSTDPLSRAPGPSPSMNTIPAPSSAQRSDSRVAAIEWPLPASKLMTVRRLTPDLLARFACVIARRPRAARHWLGRNFIEARMPIGQKICNAGGKSRCR